MSARANILDTLRAGLAAAPFVAPVAPQASSHVTPPIADPWALLAERYAAIETRLRIAATPEEAARLVADIARERSAASYARWDPWGLQGVSAEVLDAALVGLERLRPDCCNALSAADLGVTGAQAVLLDSGSLVLAAGPGRQRAVSLLPPLHVCLVAKSAILPDVGALPALLNALRTPDGRLPACVNLVTGPSSTADIELVLVRGVHGPGALEVVGLDWC